MVIINHNQTVYAQWEPVYTFAFNYTGNFTVNSETTVRTGDYDLMMLYLLNLLFPDFRNKKKNFPFLLL